MAVQGRTGIFPHRIDKTTDANASVDYEHKEVHSGDCYFVTKVVSVDSAATTETVLVTPNTTVWSHLLWQLEAQGLITVELYEGVTASPEVYLGFNRNRNYPDSPTLQVDNKTFTNGTLIYNWSSGTATPASGRTPGLQRASGELVLKQNTKYGLRITSGFNANIISQYLTWYEHRNIE